MRGTAHFRRKFFSVYDGSFVNGPDKSLYNSGSKKSPSLKLGTRVSKGCSYATAQKSLMRAVTTHLPAYR